MRAVYSLLFMVALSVYSMASAASSTYLYRQADGTLLQTDLPPHKSTDKNLTLLRIVRHAKVEPRTVYKPTSFKMCTGVQSKSMRKRAKDFEDTISSLAQQFKVSKHLVMAVVSVESCFDENAVSRAGARGLMQLMPATANSLGVDDPFDSEQNLRAGIQYLGQLSQQFDYNHKLVLAAYNAGPGNVRKYNGIPPFEETRQYITRVMENYLHFLQTPLD